jgi:hypothetical protein
MIRISVPALPLAFRAQSAKLTKSRQPVDGTLTVREASKKGMSKRLGGTATTRMHRNVSETLVGWLPLDAPGFLLVLQRARLPLGPPWIRAR